MKKLTPIALGHPLYGGKSLPRKMPAGKRPSPREAIFESSEDEDSSDEEIGIDEGAELDILH